MLIIAEAGVNHNGDYLLARRLIEAGAAAGADYVKFQTFKADALVSPRARQASYQRRNLGTSDSDDSQLSMLRRLELSYDQFRALRDECQRCGTRFLSTPFDFESIEFLSRLGMDMMKVPSGEITNLPYLRAVAATGLPIVMSTGMATLSEVEQAVSALTAAGCPLDRLTLLHCTTEYPAPYAEVNLRAMETLRSTFGTAIGYSDHTPGIEVSVAAVALGATVIEKHFTLDRNLPGPDHRASLEPDQLRSLVEAVRHVEAAMGDGRKVVTPSEAANREVARKSIVAACDIVPGRVLTADCLTVQRPGSGLSPMCWDRLIGLKAPAALPAGTPIPSDWLQ